MSQDVGLENLDSRILKVISILLAKPILLNYIRLFEFVKFWNIIISPNVVISTSLFFIIINKTTHEKTTHAR
jgi:hypothetical protein